MNHIETHTLIIGASAAGLASAACLKKKNIPFIILEQNKLVAQSWRNHYDRLHLHTNKGSSYLPYFKMPDYYTRYITRQQVVSYIEAYAKHFNLNPKFEQKVSDISRTDSDWTTTTENTKYTSKNIIVATGYTRVPYIPDWKDKNDFEGDLLHSSKYKNGLKWKGGNVLVVGFGNSACEIAICLTEHGATPTLAVRSAVNIVPRDIFGIPILTIGQFMSKLPSFLADALSAPVINLKIGNIKKLGLKKAPYGAMGQIIDKKHIPLLDIGTVELIKKGKIKIKAEGIEKFTKNGVVFTNGNKQSFDAVISGTGYKPMLSDFLKDANKVIAEDGLPYKSGVETSLKGLYFCGFYVSPSGMLREIGIEAKRIAKHIAGNQ